MEKKILNSREKQGESFTPEEELLPPEMISSMSGGWGQKVWGRTRLIHRTPQMEIHELVLETPGSFCSIHSHKNKLNIFTVLSGMVEVTKKVPGGETSKLLSHGMSTAVPSGVLHQFKTIAKDTHLLEVYLPDGVFELEGEDIARQHQGGLVGYPVVPKSSFLISKAGGA